MPGPETQPLFDEAARLGIGFCLGYAELTADGAPLQHAGARRAGRAHRRPLPQGPHPRPRARRARPAVPARRAPLLRARPGRARRVGGVRRPGRDDDLQRPALARDLPRDGAPGRRADPLRLQHPHPLRARPEPGHPPGLPQRARAAVRRVPERHVGGRRGQGRRRGGRRLAGPVVHRRPERADRRPGADDRRRADHGRLRPRLVPALHRHPVRLRPLPPPRALRADHQPTRREEADEPTSRRSGRHDRRS